MHDPAAILDSLSVEDIAAYIRSQPGFDAATFDPDAFVATLDNATIEDMLAPILAAEERAMFNKFWDVFPDDGPVARHLYPRHMEHFEAGKDFMERCFMAANRCISPWTWVQTPTGERQIADILASDAPTVLSWDGDGQCIRPMRNGFLVGIEPVFRLVMDSGRYLDCSRKHRVLTSEGWLSLDRIMSRSGGLRLWHRDEDYQANCVEDGCLDGPPPPPTSGSVPTQPPSQGDVQTPVRFHFSLPDEVVRKLRYIRACPRSDRLSSPDDLTRLSDLFDDFRAASCARPVLRLSERIRDVARLVHMSASHQQAGTESASDHILALFLDAYRPSSPDVACSLEAQLTEAPDFPRSVEPIAPHRLGQLSLHDGRRTATFFPFDHIPMIGGERIICVVPLGYQPIIDAQVPGTNNYLAAGVVNHNCGKTVAGAWEVASHLTGIYREWWPGKRFTRPISAWAAGDTNETTRDIIQKELFGKVTWIDNQKTFDGSGYVPREHIGKPTWKSGVPDLADTVPVRHRSGRWSMLGLKSYDQGRRVFQGTAKDVIWLDEECPADVYDECLIRLATTRGILITTFTPLRGMTDVVLSFLDEDMRPGG